MRNLSRSLIHARLTAVVCFATASLLASAAHAVSSAEVYTTKQYPFGRFEARIQFGSGDGIVSSFFMWKDGSEMEDVFWNELDFEKLRANCELETNALYGLPESTNSETYTGDLDLCGTFHTYTYEWTPDYIAWLIDGVEIRREIGEAAVAYRDNAPEGMQIRFNVWPGDESFGGNFDPASLPVHEYVNWVQYSAYVDGAFQFSWREDFNGTQLPSGWSKGNWSSPKSLSTHAPGNATVANGYLVLSLTADDALGAAGATPSDPAGSGSAPAASSAAAPAPSDTSGEAPATPSASATTSTPTPAAAGTDGCSCSTVGGNAHGVWSWVALGLGAIGAWKRRRTQ